MTFMQLGCVRHNHGLPLTNLTSWQVQKQACDKHDPGFYPKYKKWCDDYFLIKVSDPLVFDFRSYFQAIRLCAVVLYQVIRPVQKAP